MLVPAVGLFVFAFAISLIGTYLARRYARRLGLMDDPGHRKVHTVATPRNGGIGIFWGFTTTISLAIGCLILGPQFIFHGPDHAMGKETFPFGFSMSMQYYDGMRAHIPLLLTFLGATFLIHLLGLWDDRKAMAPWPKLLAQLAIAAALIVAGEFVDPLKGGAFRVLTSLGFVPSAIISILWIVALTNAFNFLDNMDGLSAGVAFLCALAFLVATMLSPTPQLFVAGLLIVFMGAVLGFLCFNFPPASIFMGDGGSMVLGFILSVLTIRTTYYDAGGPWYAVLMPLFVMAVPLYDLTIVMVLRLAKGRSPMTGDTNHFSHRLTRHGFSKRGAVLVIYGVTLATGMAAPMLARLGKDDTPSAILLAAQLLAMLVVIGVLERVGEHTT